MACGGEDYDIRQSHESEEAGMRGGGTTSASTTFLGQPSETSATLFATARAGSTATIRSPTVGLVLRLTGRESPRAEEARESGAGANAAACESTDSAMKVTSDLHILEEPARRVALGHPSMETGADKCTSKRVSISL